MAITVIDLLGRATCAIGKYEFCLALVFLIPMRNSEMKFFSCFFPGLCEDATGGK
jgi:hypothetical protein